MLANHIMPIVKPIHSSLLDQEKNYKKNLNPNLNPIIWIRIRGLRQGEEIIFTLKSSTGVNHAISLSL